MQTNSKFIVALFACLTLTGCGGRSESVTENLPANLPQCSVNAMTCDCNSPLKPCYAPELDKVLVCYEGLVTTLEAVGHMTNPACHPGDAGTDADSGHECETDQDCAKFNTECMFFGCLSHMCFETHDTCWLDAGNDTDAAVKCSGTFDPGAVMTTGCCPGGAMGYISCLSDGNWSACYGCQPTNDAGTDAQADADAAPQPDAADAQPAPVLNVSLSAATPPGMNLCQGAQATVLTFDLANGSDQDITVDKLRLHRIGVGSPDDITVGGIAGNYIHLGVPDSSGYLTFDTMQFVVPAKSTQSLSYWVQVNKASAQGGDQLAMEIWDANDVTLSGGAQVQGSFPVRGNTFTISSVQCGGLTASLAPNPVSGTVVKKSQNVDVLGIRVTADINDVELTQLQLKCQASINGAAYAAADCWKRVTSLALWDGNTQVGLAKAPDTLSGLAQITNMSLMVPNGMTKTLTVKVSFTSTASMSEPYDKVAVGVVGGDAQDMVYAQYVSVGIETSLANQLTSVPAVYFTILSSGTLSITDNNHPASDIVVAGKDSWVPFARYRATGQYEPMSIDRISVSSLPGGDDADFVQVAIASQGVVKGTGILPAGVIGATDIDLTGNPIQVPQDGTADFEVWAKINPTMPSAAVNGAWQGVCRSGHAPALGLSSDKQNGEWTAEYAGKLNVRTAGDKSGERIYAAKGAAAGNLMVIRKTKPVVTKQNLANSVLFHGEVELYRAQIGADSAGSVALKQMGFYMDVSNGMSLGNFRLYRGSYQVPLNEYAVTDMAHATDLKVGATQTGETNLFVIVSFAGEDIVSGSGNVYSLRATANFTGNGNYVVTKPLAGGVYPFTGWPQGNKVLGPPEVGSPSIFHVTVNNTYGLGTFLWSDQSEVPHSDVSLDWTDDYLVQDLTQSATLSN